MIISVPMKEHIITWVLGLAEKYRKQHPELREGQALFNAVNQIDPIAADELRGSNVDCFYNDKLVPDFLDALRGKKEYVKSY